jgi:hypothetical protein
MKGLPSSGLFDAIHLSKVIMAMVVVSVFVYLIFFR